MIKVDSTSELHEIFAIEDNETILYMIDFMWCYMLACRRTIRVTGTQVVARMHFCTQHSSISKSEMLNYIFNFLEHQTQS